MVRGMKHLSLFLPTFTHSNSLLPRNTSVRQPSALCCQGGRASFKDSIAPLATAGALSPVLDFPHSSAGIVSYQDSPGELLLLGSWHTNVVTFPLLSMVTRETFPPPVNHPIPNTREQFFVVAGGLFWWLDEAFPTPAPASSTITKFAYSAVSVALLNFLSGYLYTMGLDYSTIFGVMAALGLANWMLFDGSVVGLALGTAVALTAPLSEIAIMALFNTWHYPAPDFELGFGPGICSFIPAFYFIFFVPVGVLARALKQQQS